MKKAVDNIFKYTYKTILLITISAFVIALFCGSFFYTNRSHDSLNPVFLITGVILYLFLVVRLYRSMIMLSEGKQRICCIILLIFQFAALLVITQTVSSIPQVDLIHILTETNSLNETGTILNDNYYSVYPNNKFLLMFLYGISRISPEHTDIIFGLLSGICISTMSFFTYMSVKLIADRRKALACLFICILSPIFYLYAPYYYTDILMLPFASALFYLVIKNDRMQRTGKNICCCLLIGLIAIVGYKIRAVSIFILVAYFVYQILSKQFKSLVKSIIPILLSAVLTLSVITGIEGIFFTENDTSKEFPMTHWIMMGVNEESGGYYSQADYDLSYSTENKEDRTALNISEIKNRLKELGFGGTLKLIVSKINAVWAKGDYSYQKYLELSGDYNSIYRYLIEDENIVLNYILQINKIGILFLAVLALLKLFKDNRYSVIAIALFGAVIFYIAWEVCPRYGLSFLPWMILLCSYSFDSINIDTVRSKPCRYIRYSVVAITVISLCIGAFTCMSAEQRSNIIAKDTVKKVKYISLNRDTVLTQSLDLYGDFDELKLKFNINGTDPDSTYKLELTDTNSDAVYQKEFTTADINDGKYTSFKLDDTYPKGEYYLRLSTNSDNGAQVYISYKEKFDYYPEGDLYINGNKETGDIMFEIKNTEQRPLYSIGEYIILCIVTLGTEYLVLFKKERKENE